VRHLGKGIDHVEHALPIGFRNAHRGQNEGAAHALDLKHRAEAGQHARVEHRLQAFEQFAPR
jgi:hypothetical protein